MQFDQIFKTWREVYGKWEYSLLALFIAVFFYLLNVIVAGWKSLAGFYSSFGFIKALDFLWVLLIGFRESITTTSFVSLIVISLMLGMLFSMLVYKHHIYTSPNDKKYGILGGVGAFIAALIPGCAACGIGFASVLGLSAGALSFLPYNGIELSVLAIVILGITIFKTTKNMYVCMVPITSKFKFRKLKGGKKK